MGRRALESTVSLIVSVCMVSVVLYFLVYTVANVPVSHEKRSLTEDEDRTNETRAEGELPLCPRKPTFFSEYCAKTKKC